MKESWQFPDSDDWFPPVSPENHVTPPPAHPHLKKNQILRPLPDDN